eukprot:gene5316-biopygen23691
MKNGERIPELAVEELHSTREIVSAGAAAQAARSGGGQRTRWVGRAQGGGVWVNPGQVPPAPVLLHGIVLQRALVSGGWGRFDGCSRPHAMQGQLRHRGKCRMGASAHARRVQVVKWTTSPRGTASEGRARRGQDRPPWGALDGRGGGGAHKILGSKACCGERQLAAGGPSLAAAEAIFTSSSSWVPPEYPHTAASRRKNSIIPFGFADAITSRQMAGRSSGSLPRGVQYQV